LRHLSARVLSRVRHFLPFFVFPFFLPPSFVSLPLPLSFSREGADREYVYSCRCMYELGHQSCDYLPSPLIGTIYIRRGSRVSRLGPTSTGSRNFRRFTGRIGVSFAARGRGHLLHGYGRSRPNWRARDFVGIAAHRGNLKRLSRFSSVRKTIGASRVYYGSILRLHVSVPRSLMETTCWKLRMRFEDNSMSGRA